MAVGTTQYPAAIDTTTQLIQVANAASSAIDTGGVNNSATTIPVVSTASAPSDGVAWCGTEAISYTGKTATTLTGCVRGFDATTAASHAAGDPIYFDIITSAHHEALRGAIIAVETVLGTRSAAAQSGAVRLDNAQWITARKADNSADMNLVRLNANNRMEFGNTDLVWDITNSRLGINVAAPLYPMHFLATTETTPTAGSVAGITSILGEIGPVNVPAYGALFIPTSRFGHVIGRRTSTFAGITMALSVLMNNQVSDVLCDAVGLFVHANAGVTDGSAYAMNLVAQAEAVDAQKIVGLEIDMQTVTGATNMRPGSCGLMINAIGPERIGPALTIIGGLGGLWDFGVQINNIRTDGVGLVVQSGAPSMDYGIHLNNGTYGTAAAIMGAQNDKPALILQRGVSGGSADIFQVTNHVSTKHFCVQNDGVVKSLAPMRLESTFPQMIWYETDGGTNAKHWDLFVQGEVMSWRILSDDLGTAADWLRVTRIGAAIFSIVFNNDQHAAPIRFAGDTDANMLYLDSGTDSVGIGLNAPTAWLHIKAGTTNQPPLKYTSGTNLTTAEAGAVEFDGAVWYMTADTTNGRAHNLTQQEYRLTADSSALASATIADYFPATSSLPTVAGATYEIFYYLYFTKTTAGTVVYTITSSTAPTRVKADYVMTPVGGVGTVGTPQTAAVKSTTATAVAMPASGSLTTAVDHRAIIRVLFTANTAGNVRLRITPSAGTVTPLADSYYVARRLPASTGTFV